METLLSADVLIPFATLFALELVLGIDNIIFISILSGKLPKQDQNRARLTGLSLAVITRIGLLMSLSWLIGLTEPMFHIFEKPISGRDLILLAGGLFLLIKSTYEIHNKITAQPHGATQTSAKKFWGIILQILLLDIVFSIDSVITAVGMVNDISVMVSAIIASTIVMVFFAKPVSDFVDQNPTIKILALSFLLLIGCALIADGWGTHIPKGYIYFSMAFSFFVELLNLKMRKKGTP